MGAEEVVFVIWQGLSQTGYCMRCVHMFMMKGILNVLISIVVSSIARVDASMYTLNPIIPLYPLRPRRTIYGRADHPSFLPVIRLNFSSLVAFSSSTANRPFSDRFEM